MKVVGFAGQMQNGKDTAADYLFEKIKHKWGDVERASFADNVKRIFCETFNVDRSFVEEWKTKSEIPEGFDSPVRQGLQQIGDGFRKIQGKIWIELAFRDRANPAIFSDVRLFAFNASLITSGPVPSPLITAIFICYSFLCSFHSYQEFL